MKLLVYALAIKAGVPDPGNATLDATFDTRVQRLRDLVQNGFQKLDAFRDSHPLDATALNGVANPDKPLYVFAAPEWLFRFKRDQFRFNAGEYFTKDHLTRYLELVQSLSTRSNADVLMVAGSMHWIQERTEIAASELAAATRKYEEAKAAKYQDGRVRPEKRLAEEKRVTDVRQGIASPEFKKRYLGYNEAYVFFNGAQKKVIQKSAEAGDFGWGGGPEHSPIVHIEMVFGLGAGTVSLPLYGGKLKVGVGICFDHSRVRNYGKEVDLYILVSCSQSLFAGKKYVRDNGLIVHADCERCTEVLGCDGNKSVVFDYDKPYLTSMAIIETAT